MPLSLCATARLAQALRQQVPQGAGASWETPRALTLGAWLAGVVEDAALAGACPPVLLLDAACERLLWEQVIAEGLPPEALPLFDVAGLAAAAQEAHALCIAWDLQPQPAHLAEEGRRFLAWRREFSRRAAARGWTESARLPALARELIKSGAVELPPAIAFAGFDRYTPAEKRLWQALAARGVAVSEGARPAAAPSTQRSIACDDAGAEARAIAAWARERLAARADARLGVVVPDLSARREALAFALDDALHPQAVLPGRGSLARAYNFSLGTPLGGEALVRTALDLLALGVTPRHEQAALSELLRSPFWSAGQGEADSRARIDAALREELEYFTDLPALQRLVGRLYGREGIEAPRLAGHMAAFSAVWAAAGSRRRPPSAWAGVFRQALEAIAWPGDRSLWSGEFQARQAFLATLDSLGRYDELLPAIGAGEAHARLARLCGEQVFQPETRGRPSIEIVGILESTGLAFDALWVAGMNDEAWPPSPRPNPLLPAELQRRAGTPHASAEVELAFASAVHARLLGAAPELIFSWRRQEGTRLLRPSPLLDGIAEACIAAAAPPPPAAPGLERLRDAVGPPVAAGEKVSGGTGLLKAQAICPAWGFFQYRLGARALKEPVEGLDAAARGTLVHGALEHFWGATASLAGLHALDCAALERAIGEAVSAALQTFEQETRRVLPPRFRRLEAGRLERLLAVWLEFEATRQENFTVVARELEVLLNLDPIQVRTVIDRIDRFDDGRCLVLDYKTGKNIDARNWAEMRISEPQLPLYAAIAAPLAGNEAVAGAAFAKVRADEPAFAGVADEADLLPGVAGLDDPARKLFPATAFPDWPAVLAHWRQRLAAIAAEVGAGEAAIRFSDAKALAHCEVLPLLRLAERAQQWDEAPVFPAIDSPSFPAP